MTIDKTLNKEETPAMFNNIANTYDKLNHLLSFGLDKRWRKVFVKKLKFRSYNNIADIASGTGDLLVSLQDLNPDKCYAIDPAKNMLEVAKTKIPKAEFIISEAESLPLKNESCDLISVSFGIRNFTSLERAFSEFYRILRKGGIVSIMEFSQPKFFIFRWGFIIYLKLFLPLIGSMVSKDKSAYKYLQTSIFDFAKNVDVFTALERQNFNKHSQSKFLFGAVRIYTCVKK